MAVLEPQRIVKKVDLLLAMTDELGEIGLDELKTNLVQLLDDFLKKTNSDSETNSKVARLRARIQIELK